MGMEWDMRFLQTTISTYRAYMWEYKLETQWTKTQIFMQKNAKCRSMENREDQKHEANDKILNSNFTAICKNLGSMSLDGTTRT